MAVVLVLYDSRGGLVEELAQGVAAGVRDTAGAELMLRRVDEADPRDLLLCDGLIVGSPNWSGITGKLKLWFDETGDLWESGDLAGKPAGAFTGGWSRSGGTEATLLQLLHLLMAHGMLMVGLPWTDRMRTTGSYYGATAHGHVTPGDIGQARALGQRVAGVAVRLAD
ncbi:MAG: NAD(P)H-dependent oxidoreductase [Chloroflexi bacterium]|nr:NAD(P)H-dependent oxidoreductase [Chloroflexota bacterium]